MGDRYGYVDFGTPKFRPDLIDILCAVAIVAALVTRAMGYW